MYHLEKEEYKEEFKSLNQLKKTLLKRDVIQCISQYSTVIKIVSVSISTMVCGHVKWIK